MSKSGDVADAAATSGFVCPACPGFVKVCSGEF